MNNKEYDALRRNMIPSEIMIMANKCEKVWEHFFLY